jgi:hypothetical protein
MATESATEKEIEQALARLLRYCRAEDWAGYDPYDGLNSPLVSALTFRSRALRTIATQAIKRSPVNLRPVLGIRKGYNPKGLALAARALTCLLTHGEARLVGEREGALKTETESLLTRIGELRSDSYSEACWGYNFDWQSRAFFAPRGTPNVVCTVFAAHAFLDWYWLTGKSEDYQAALSCCRFLLDRINRTEGRGGFCFSYTPLDRSRVHNVNLLAAELLARVWALERRDEYREAALGATSYTVARQSPDGSWRYGEDSSQGWIDSFHTGFALVSLKNIGAHLGSTDFREPLERGYEFYAKRFFLADSTPGYYHDHLYPVDVHSAAQAIVTFVEMTDLIPTARQMASRVAAWTIGNLQDAAGFFHFQRHRLYTIRIPYMRWSQAWMMYALSRYLTRDRSLNV